MYERFNKEKTQIGLDAYEGLKLYWPMISDDMLEWYDLGKGRILVITPDNAFEYDNNTHGIRRTNPLDEFGYEEGDEEYYKHNFGRKLDMMIRARCMRQDTLAEIVGTSQTMISNYIRGANMPSYYILVKIAKALQCSLDELV